MAPTLARAMPRTSNVNRCISARHDSGMRRSRPSALPSPDCRKRRKRTPPADLRSWPLPAHTGYSSRSRAQMPVPRSQPSRLSMRLKRDSLSWFRFLSCSKSPMAERYASRHRNASLVNAPVDKRDVKKNLAVASVRDLIVDIFLRPSEQMDDAGGRDGDEHKARQMMRADEDRVDVQCQRQRQHGVHRARRECDDDVGEAHMGGQRNHR